MMSASSNTRNDLLPQELLLNIFHYLLSSSDVLTAMCVCSSWREPGYISLHRTIYDTRYLKSKYILQHLKNARTGNLVHDIVIGLGRKDSTIFQTPLHDDDDGYDFLSMCPNFISISFIDGVNPYYILRDLAYVHNQHDNNPRYANRDRDTVLGYLEKTDIAWDKCQQVSDGVKNLFYQANLKCCRTIKSMVFPQSFGPGNFDFAEYLTNFTASSSLVIHAGAISLPAVLSHVPSLSQLCYSGGFISLDSENINTHSSCLQSLTL